MRLTCPPILAEQTMENVYRDRHFHSLRGVGVLRPSKPCKLFFQGRAQLKLCSIGIVLSYILAIKWQKIPWESYSWSKFPKWWIIDFLYGVVPPKLIFHFAVNDFATIQPDRDMKNLKNGNRKGNYLISNFSIWLVELWWKVKPHLRCENAIRNNFFSYPLIIFTTPTARKMSVPTTVLRLNQ